MTQGKRIVVVLSCFLVFLPIVLSATCPGHEEIAPCTCDVEYSEVKITCHGIDDEELARVASNLREQDVYSFTVENSTLGFIPYDVFKGVKLRCLKFEYSTLAALTDESEAFVGLEEHLDSLFLWDCVLKQDWDWTVLRNLKKLKTLSVYGTLHPEIIGTEVMKASVPGVEFFIFSEANITFTDHAFDSFENIRRLILSHNKIISVKRTILPNPALELTAFDLSDNLIEQFPEDMFTNMPMLRFLYIGNNRIQVLDEQTFSPVWGQLICLSTSGNAHRCDCSMTWIVKKKSSPSGIHGKCASPPRLSGRDLEKLKSKDRPVMCPAMS